MALDNHSNLKAAIIRLDGSNDLADILDDCILMAETEMYNNQRVSLRCRELQTTVTTSTGTGDEFLSLPTRFLEFRGMHIIVAGQPVEISYSSPESLKRKSSAGRPEQYTVADQIEFNRVPDSDYPLKQIYYAKELPLDATNSTNSVLTNYPNIYVFGALWAANLYNAEEDKADFYYQQFLRAIRGANQSTRQSAGPVPSMRIEGPTP